MATLSSDVACVAPHPTVQAKIDAMQKARRQELAELRGSALGFVQCQMELGSEDEVYQASVAARVNDAFNRRELYLINVRTALLSFFFWFHLGVMLFSWFMGSLWRDVMGGVLKAPCDEELVLAMDPLFYAAVPFFIFFQAGIHMSIGFNALWHEVCRHKSVWLFTLILPVLFIISNVVHTATEDRSGAGCPISMNSPL